MAQVTTGWRKALAMPFAYRAAMRLLGGRCSRPDFVRVYIQPEPGMRILDLGCGPAAILEYLPETTHYVGVDMSRKYIDDARAKYGDRGVFHCLPLNEVVKVGQADFDMVLGLGLLHHLDDAQAQYFFSIAASMLRNGGRCLTLDPCFVQGQHPVARFLISKDRGQNVRTVEQYVELGRTSFRCIDQFIRHDLLRVPYTHFIMRSWSQRIRPATNMAEVL